MPVYEYECPKCHKVQEIWRSMYETEEGRCSTCSVEMNKLISKSSFQLKGGGWYADGYCKNREDTGGQKKPADAGNCPEAGKNKKPACAACS